MIRRCCLFIMLGMACAITVHAKLNPLRTVTANQLRADVLIVVDTSGSMSSGVCATCTNTCSNVSGNDCYGDRAGVVDVCGDGMCSGIETSANCAIDCTLNRNDDPLTLTDAPAGQAPSCSADYVSRLAMVKRSLRAAAPMLRTAANFGLITFQQTGYYTYYPATVALPSKPVSVFLAEWELKQLGGWDTTNDAPANSVAWPATSGTGEAMTLVSGSTLAVGADSLYRRSGDSSAETRFPWSTAGRRYDDGSGDWVYQGSYYTYNASAINTTAPTRVEIAYQGPQFFDGATTWVYQRYAPATCVFQEQGINGEFDDEAKLVQGLTASQAQADQDLAVGKLLGHLNATPNGGIFATGKTPLGAAIALARDQFVARAASDTASACRERIVLVITDGDTMNGRNPTTEAQSLHNVDPSNPIRTFVIGLPSSNMTTLDGIAAAGGTGHAYFADNEQTLIDVLEDTLFASLTGSYATTEAGVGTETGSTIEGNVALLPTVEFPGWTGRLRAIDVTTKCAGPTPPANTPCTRGSCVDGHCELWDAGERLAMQTWSARRLYTGLHSLDSGNAIRLVASDGTVCTTAGAAADCSGTVGLNDVWWAVVGTAPPANLPAAIRWLAGNGRSWKLPAIINSVPATVGPPTEWQGAVPGHDELETRQAARQTLAYVTSSEGLLHAFDLQSGREEFAFLSGHLLPKVVDLYNHGGQNPDPDQFEWVMANSPRVEDLKDGSGLWQTYLVQTAGPGNDQFVVLDITDPSFCTNPLDSSTCSMNSPPVVVSFSSVVASPAINTTFGQSWSLPALFWTASETPRAAMGSGYDVTPGDGSYYNVFYTIAQPDWQTTRPADLDSQLLSGGSAQVNDYAVVADTVAVTDPSGPRHVIATYQADLAGRITRYTRGERGLDAIIMDNTEGAGPGHPFYFAPAALYRDGLNTVTLAMASGAFQEDDPSWNPAFESRLYRRMENDSVVDPSADNVTCAISEICSGACFNETVASCMAPSNKALPIGSPLLIENLAADGRPEAFWVYYDPPAATCTSAGEVAVGDTWIIRTASDISGNTSMLVGTRKLAATMITGLAIVGGGSDFVLTQSGQGGERASIETFTGTPVTSVGLTGAPVIESWREVQ